MDECVLVDGVLIDDELVLWELVAVVTCVLHDDGVTVTVTVFCGQLPQSKVHCGVRGTAAASPNRDAKITLECILSKKRANIKRVC